jgi:glycine cleavage system regulatory protein
MPTTLIFSIMGADRPGLVAQLAATVADHRGNWVESRLVRLGGQFAGVLRVEVPEERTEALTDAVRQLEQAGLNSICRCDLTSMPPEHASRLVKMQLIGSDRPGILKGISQTLARHLVNIEELSTERRAAPMSGEALFEASAIVHIPPSATLAALRKDLETIADDLMVDLLFGER